jgi:hypothetical protein
MGYRSSLIGWPSLSTLDLIVAVKVFQELMNFLKNGSFRAKPKGFYPKPCDGAGLPWRQRLL